MINEILDTMGPSLLTILFGILGWINLRRLNQESKEEIKQSFWRKDDLTEAKKPPRSKTEKGYAIGWHFPRGRGGVGIDSDALVVRGIPEWVDRYELEIPVEDRVIFYLWGKGRYEEQLAKISDKDEVYPSGAVTFATKTGGEHHAITPRLQTDETVGNDGQQSDDKVAAIGAGKRGYTARLSADGTKRYRKDNNRPNHR
jgi:hypothetical protein